MRPVRDHRIRQDSRRGLIAHRAHAAWWSRTVLRGIPVTTTARTLLDVRRRSSTSSTLGAVRGDVAVDGRRHRRRARRHARRRNPGTAGIEAVALKRLTSCGLVDGAELARRRLAAVPWSSATACPDRCSTMWCDSADGAVYELDWSYPDLQLALELDGYGVHRALEGGLRSGPPPPQRVGARRMVGSELHVADVRVQPRRCRGPDHPGDRTPWSDRPPIRWKLDHWRRS